MMDAVFGAPQPTKETLGLIHGRAVIALELSGVIDPQYRIGRVQRIPGTRLVGVHRCAACDVLAF